MKTWKIIFAAFLFVSVLSLPLQAAEVVFVENADDMVEQIIDSGGKYSVTRSFVVTSEPTRAIRVRTKNSKGEEEIVVVQVPESGIDPAARMKVEFDVNSASLRPSSYSLLAELGKAVQDERVVDHNVCIKGHTDSDGDVEYNLKLSFDRANSVLQYLQGAFGISACRFKVFGYGESMPLLANTTGANKQKNRRVEVSLNCPEIE